MATRNIKCAGCGHEGKVEAHDTVNDTPESDIFKTLGKDSSTGFLRFICPSCNEDLSVDPFKVIMASQIIGKPSNYSPPSSSASLDSSSSPEKDRRGYIIGGIIYLVVAFFIFIKFSWWWTYIVGGIIFILGLGSFISGILASKKKITEHTDEGPVSEETNMRDYIMRFIRIHESRNRPKSFEELSNKRRLLYQIIQTIDENPSKEIIKRSEIVDEYKLRSEELNFVPTDYCYDMANMDDHEVKFLLSTKTDGEYKFVDFNWQAEGERIDITWEPSGKKVPEELKGNKFKVGIYQNGEYRWDFRGFDEYL